MKALLLAVRSSFQQYATVSDRTIHRALQRNVSVKLRDRSRDENVAELHQALVNVAYPPFAAKRSRAYSKGAYADKAKTSRRTLIDELFSEEPTLNGQIKEVFERFEKELPKDLTSYLERVFRTADGGANPVAEVQQYQNRGLAPRAERVGQMVFLDASTSKCDVENGFGTSSDSGYKRQFFFLCRDVKSRRVFGYMHPAQSEDYGWGGGLPSWDEGTIKTSGNAFEYFLGAMGNAPEVASIDRKSGVATQLLHLHPEKPINVMPGVLLWLAAGVHFHIRQGGRKTGGSYVERDVRTVQDYIEGIEARLAVSKELSGMGFRADRQFDSEAEQRRAFAETIQKVNELLVKCPNGYAMPEGVGLRTRGQIWKDGAAELTNALATDWKQRWYDVIRRARVGIVSKRQVKFGYGRETLRADLEGAVSDLNGPLADYSGEEAISISIPGGILASDTPGLVRVFIIDQRAGKLPRILRAQAHLARVDDAMQPVRRPTAGQFYGLPDREADAATRFRNNAVGAWKETAAALRTGTTDTPVGTQDVDSRFS